MWIRSSTNHSLVSSSARPDPAEDRRRGDPDVGQDELRVPVGERVGVVRVVLDDDAGRVVVDQEERRPPLVAVDDEAVEDHEVGVVRSGHEPLLAVEDVLPGRRVADGGRAQGPRVGAGPVLGDGVAPRALAAERRVEVAPPLIRRRRGPGRCRRPGCTTTGRRSTGRAARGRAPARAPTSPARRPRPGASRRGAGRLMAAARIGSPQSRGTRPPARSNSTSRGWRTSRTKARARAWSSSWPGVRVRSIAGKDAPRRHAPRRTASRGTGRCEAALRAADRARSPCRSRPTRWRRSSTSRSRPGRTRWPTASRRPCYWRRRC